MTNSTSGKHMVWVEKPIGTRVGIAYSTLKEAQDQTVSLERDGYKIIEIVPTSLPKPNVV
jgi:hypothetical protein